MAWLRLLFGTWCGTKESAWIYIDSLTDFYDEKSLVLYETTDKTIKKRGGRLHRSHPCEELPKWYLIQMTRDERRLLRKQNRRVRDRIGWGGLTHVIPTLKAWTILTDTMCKYHCSTILSIGCGAAFWELLLVLDGYQVTCIDRAQHPYAQLPIINLPVRNLRYHPELVTSDVLWLGWPSRNGYDFGAWKAFRGRLVVFLGQDETRPAHDVGSKRLWELAIPSMTLLQRCSLPHCVDNQYVPIMFIYLHNIQAANNLD